jgi:uncharacterized membrane protein
MLNFLNLSPELAQKTDLHCATKLILGRIRAFPDGCPMTQKDFSSELGLSGATVYANINWLIKEGYITKEKYGLLKAVD